MAQLMNKFIPQLHPFAEKWLKVLLKIIHGFKMEATGTSIQQGDCNTAPLLTVI